MFSSCNSNVSVNGELFTKENKGSSPDISCA